ncbi:hypothetical protein MY4038_004177 [Beauveria bassiana]
MSSSQDETSWGDPPGPDDSNYKEREEEIINLIKMSIEALSHMEIDPEPDMENMAKWFAHEAVTNSTSLDGEVQAKAYKQLSDCCGARNEWVEALAALEVARAVDEDGWTNHDARLYQVYTKFVRLYEDSVSGADLGQWEKYAKRTISVLDDK